MRLRNIFKTLAPEGIWLKRTVLIFIFIFFDYIVTIFFCDCPFEEGNVYARTFMLSYGKILGLTIFAFIIALPIYIVFYLDSRFVQLPPNLFTKVNLIIDLAFGWLVAGAHFKGAASWFWPVPQLTAQLVGFIIYEIVALSSFYPFSPVYCGDVLNNRRMSIER